MVAVQAKRVLVLTVRGARVQMRRLKLVIMVHKTDRIQTELTRVRTVYAALTGHRLLLVLSLTLISMILKPKELNEERRRISLLISNPSKPVKAFWETLY